MNIMSNLDLQALLSHGISVARNMPVQTAKTSRGLWQLGSSVVAYARNNANSELYHTGARDLINKGGISGGVGLCLALLSAVYIPHKTRQIYNDPAHPFFPVVWLIVILAAKILEPLVNFTVDTRDYYYAYGFHRSESERSLAKQLWPFYRDAQEEKWINFSIRYRIQDADREPIERKQTKTVHLKTDTRNFWSLFSYALGILNSEKNCDPNQPVQLTSMFSASLDEEEEIQIRFYMEPWDHMVANRERENTEQAEQLYRVLRNGSY